MSIASLYPSINPSLLLDFANTKQLDPRITFTRTTTATYYDGVTTAKAEENLFLYSQQMDNASGWTTFGITVTADNANAPDGTTTAELLTATSGTSGKLIQNGTLSPASSTTYTFSFFIKAGTHNFIQFMNANDAQAYANFNASTGALGNYGSNTTATITSVGNSWYRCVLTFSSAATLNSSFRWYMVASNTAAWASSLAAAGTETMYIWGAQAEQRSSATAYTATTTQAITNYIPVLQTAAAGQARFDHNPTTGESLGLLIEEARTNKILYSEQFDNAAWSLYGTTVTTNAIVSPNGLQNGEKIVETTANDIHRISQGSISVTSGTAYTFTVYAKAGERTFIENRIYDGSTNAGVATFDLVNGTVSGVTGSASMTLVGNGWYRCVLTATATATSSSALGLIYLKISSGVDTWTGNGFSGVFVWGAQLEAGSFATSYIPTTTASATRNADAASMTGTNFSSWFNYGEMTIYAEATGYEAGSYDIIDLDSGSNTGRIRTRFASDYQVNQLDASVAQTFSLDGGSVTAKSFAKIAAGLTQNSQALSLNGGSVATATAPFTTQPAPTTARIGSNFAGSNYLNGTIKKIAFYPVKATNAQLQALTV